ncbi:MAG: MBL fold metallo-hydrolase [bacterium]|nr:MBL fold metallo-hydrolase [bacterium]
MKLTFYGGAQSVTGANYLLEFEDSSSLPVRGTQTGKTGTRKILIDCGLIQGCNFCEKQNFEPFPYNPEEISELFITHAHIDHCGRAPKLVKDGFRGKVYSTPPTRDFAKHLLFDSENLLEREAEKQKRDKIYDEHHIEKLMDLWQGVEYEEEMPIGKSGAVAVLHSAGHILGSASIEIRAEGKTILFSGDLGNSPAPLIGPPAAPCKADYCLIEAVYGDRIHEDLKERRQKLQAVVENSIKRGGTLMIPAFSMARTQALLLELRDIFEQNKIEKVPIFLDSPLAIKLTDVYNQYRGYFKEELQHRFATAEKIFDFPHFKKTLLKEESIAIRNVKGPKIIIAGSGMSNGGRILHHEKNYLPDPASTLLIFGYQAKNTLGRDLLEGARQVKILGQNVSVRATVKAIGGYSAHADQSQLLKWAEPLKGSLKKMFVVQGEEPASKALAKAMREVHGFDAVVPQHGQTVEL